MSFIKKMFTLNVKDYLDISMDVYINIILFVIAVVLCLASFAINHHRAYTYRIIRQLLRREATSEDKAKTIGELHLNLSRSLKGALSRNGQLTDIVKRAGYVKPSYEEYVALMKDKRNRKKKETVDFDTARFYIPEDKLERAQRISEKGEPTVLRTLLVCVLIIALCVCISLAMPELLRLIGKAEESL